ncbi:MAG TPA: hypothetical protein VMV10_25670 [Pirellulales bacterium]|nr:hypothetical protein [Pirellulales bacterium]
MQPHPDPPIESPALPESRIRFSLRGVFIGTAAAAAILALLAPWFRQWDDAEQTYFVVFWANAAVGAAATAAIGCTMRVRLERRAGRAYYRLPRCVSRFAFFGLGAPVVQFVLLAVSSSLHSTRINSGPFPQWAVFDWFAILLGAGIAMTSFNVCWNAGLEICEKGLITNGVLIPWNLIRGYRWAASNPGLLLIQCRHSVVSVNANAADKPTIEQCLDKPLAANSQPPE